MIELVACDVCRVSMIKPVFGMRTTAVNQPFLSPFKLDHYSAEALDFGIKPSYASQFLQLVYRF